MAHEIWPYRRAPESTFQFSPWSLWSETDPQPLPTYLEGWDPLTDVHVEREVRCDVAALRSTTGLAEPIPLTLCVSWLNEQSHMTESLYRAELTSEQVIRVALPARRLGGSIRVITSITVSTTDRGRNPGSARWAGSVLARDEHRIVLEGTGPMFPMTAVDFASTRYSPNASWALQFPEDLSLPTLGTVVLLVNTRDRDLNAALNAARPNSREALLLDELETAVGVGLLELAIARQAEIEAEVWQDQSAGALLATYLRIALDHNVFEAVATGDIASISASLVGAARSEGFGRRLA